MSNNPLYTFRTYIPLAGKEYGPTPPKGESAEDGIVRTDYMRDILTFMRTDPGQRRPEIEWSTKLATAALTRVVKMAHEGWSGHVDPKGKGPDWYVRQAQYILPPWYSVLTEGDASNHVESLAYGGWWGTTAKELWQGWLSSPTHRKHVLGEDTFASQVNVGIATYYLEGSIQKMYTSVITAPLEPIQIR